MYYGKVFFDIMNTAKERVYLYNRGSECIDVTGGWSITGGNIFKRTEFIEFTNAARGTRRISTNNKITYNSNDRVIMVLETGGGTNSSYQLYLFHGLNSSVGRFSSTKSMSMVSFIPNIQATRTLFLSRDISDFISIVNGYATWKIHEVYIEKY